METIYINIINRVFDCDLFANNRIEKNVYGRMLFAYILKTKHKYSYCKIGRLLNKNHATIIHYVKLHEYLFKFDREYSELAQTVLSDKRYSISIKPKRWLCKETKFTIKRIKA